jgi:hypothetical protein
MPKCYENMKKIGGSMWFIYFSRQPLGEGMGNFLGDLLDEKNEPH